MKQTFLILIGLLMTAISSYAQTLTGKVIDTNNRGIPYVTIRILKNDSTFVQGTITDSVGVFTFKTPPMERFLLYVNVSSI